MLALVAESGLAGSLEVVEAHPILDRENTTALTAMELVASPLGMRIRRRACPGTAALIDVLSCSRWTSCGWTGGFRRGSGSASG